MSCNWRKERCGERRIPPLEFDVRIVTIHQHDPGSASAGGISTFINSFVKYAPPDFKMTLIGVSTEPDQGPPGRWQKIRIGNKECDFLPVIAVHPALPGRVPVTLRMTWALHRYLGSEDLRGAVLVFHRIEPSWAACGMANPKVLFLHGNTKDLYNPMTEVKWARFPPLYFWLESRLICRMQKIYTVRQDAVGFYRSRYPKLSDRISFLSTWVDGEVFFPLQEGERTGLRETLARAHGFGPADPLFLYVGRFEKAKDPEFLLEAFRIVSRRLERAHLVMAGDGSLRVRLEAAIARNGLDSRVHLLGAQPPREVARWMNAADVLCLSSAFEGMPIAVLEALRCGLPVVCPRVGEVGRVIGEDAACGRVVDDRTPGALAQAMEEVFRQPRNREACSRRAEPYTAARVLGSLYRDLQELAEKFP